MGGLRQGVSCSFQRNHPLLSKCGLVNCPPALRFLCLHTTNIYTSLKSSGKVVIIGKVHRLIAARHRVNQHLSPCYITTLIQHLSPQIGHCCFLRCPIRIMRVPQWGFAGHSNMSVVIIIVFGQAGSSDGKRTGFSCQSQGITSGLSDHKSIIIACECSVASATNIFGVSLIVTPCAQHCIGQIRWFSTASA